MRIVSAQLNDFGNQRDLFADLDAPVTGIFGPNGTGKSTLLRGLRWAFTGLLDDNAETYVRNYDPTFTPPEPPPTAEGEKVSKFEDPNRPANASIEVKFRKGGKEGIIYRQIGKTRRQWLQWGEHTGKNVLRSVAEIQNTLTGILGADQRALDEAVFIPQGEMHTRLFGDDNDRETLYARVLLVAFCQQIAKKAADMAAKLSANVKDLQTTQDEAVAVVASARSELHRLIADSNAYPAIEKPALDTFERWAASFQHLLAKIAEGTTAAHDLQGAETRAAEALSHFLAAAGATDRAVAEQLLTDTQSAIAKASASISLLDAVDQANRRVMQANIERQAAHEALPAATSNEASARATLASQPDPEELDSKVRASDQAKTWKVQFAGHTATIEALIKERPSLEARVQEITQQGEIAGKELLEAQQAEATPRFQVELLEKLAAVTTGSCCPVCASEVDASRFGPSALAQARAELAKAQQRTAEVRTRHQRLTSEYTEAYAKLKSNKTSAETAEIARRGILSAAGLSNVAQLDLRILAPEIEAQLRATIPNLRSLKAQLPSLQRQLQDAAARVGRADAELLAALSQQESARAVAAGLSREQFSNLPELQQRADTLQQRLRSLQSADSEVTTRRATLARLQKEFAQAQEANNADAAAINTFPLLQTQLTKVPVGDDRHAYIRECRAEVQRYQQHCAELRARVSQQERVLQDASQRETMVREAIERNEKQKLLVDDMRALQRLFTRDGLPIYYIRQRFSEIVELTSEYLARLDSDFVVRADPTRTVAFQYMQLNSSVDVWLPQEKLSGGQKVRLTAAFLLAIGPLVIPEVGLLILDEPSMHLDEQGRSSLAEMFQVLTPILISQDAQLIVCDHADEIANALPRKIMLKKQISV